MIFLAVLTTGAGLAFFASFAAGEAGFFAIIAGAGLAGFRAGLGAGFFAFGAWEAGFFAGLTGAFLAAFFGAGLGDFLDLVAM